MDDASKLYAKADYKSAAHLYRKEIERNPNNALAHQELARCMFQLRDISAAWSEANQALRLEPGLAFSHLVLSNILAIQKNYQQAEEEARMAIQLDPSMWEAYNALGNILGEQGKLADSLSAFKKAIELAPDSWQLRFNLSLMLWRSRLFSDSMKEAQKSFRLRPSPQTAYWLYRVFLHLNRMWIALAFTALVLLAIWMPSAISLGIRAVLLTCLLVHEMGEIKYGQRKHGLLGLAIVVLLGTVYLLFGKPP